MANLGFVGLGLMGSRIVKRLLAAGHQVSGYNRTRESRNTDPRGNAMEGITTRSGASRRYHL